MMGKKLNGQTIYILLRELDSTILEKFGFGSCNLSRKKLKRVLWSDLYLSYHHFAKMMLNP